MDIKNHFFKVTGDAWQYSLCLCVYKYTRPIDDNCSRLK